MQTATARHARFAAAILALIALAQIARAQDDPKALEKTFKKIAKEASPKTVCVKSYIELKGDKAGFGSGAIVSQDGYVLTCAHVVDIAKRCEVILADGSVYPAKILGRNKRQDYALLKIEPKAPLTPYTIGDSTKVKIGDWVCALGHPGGPYADLKPAFAAGRVTGLHRRLPVQFFDRFYDDAIQTDVPIFAGNSGGPLVSLDGELIGLNGAILILNENAYAVPIQEIMPNYAALQKGENIVGKQATQEDMAELQKQIGPEEMQKLFSRAMKNFGKLFGGGGGGENGEGPDLSKLFEQFGKMFGNGGGPKKDNDGDDDDPSEGQGPDMSKLMEGLQKMFGGGGGENGEAPDMKKMMEQLQKMLGGGGGGENGEGPDLQKMFGKLFGNEGGGDDDGDEDKPTAPKKDAPRAPAGYVGVQLSKDAAKAKQLGGVIVEEVLEGSPAAKAGLKKDDVIVAVNGVGTPDPDTLRREVGQNPPGTKTVFTIDRPRRLDATVVIERKDVTVTIGQRPPAQPGEGR